MKKSLLVLAILLTAFLAACGGSEDAKEVYNKAVEASENAESAEIDLTINQTMTGEPMMGELQMDMDMQVAVTMDPIAMHQKGNISMDLQGVPMDTEMEMYMIEDVIYMQDSMSKTWLKLDASTMPAEFANVDQAPNEQLDLLASFVDDVEFIEEDDVYIYKFEGEGDEIEDFTQKLVAGNLNNDTFTELGVDVEELFAEMTIHSIYYELHIDKSSYDTKKVITNIDIELPIDADDNAMRIYQEMTAEYIGIDTIDQIEVPQEVIDSAQEM
ncbi:DUF6612 family protein [Oceanobacillus sp. CAU 1775]